MIDLTGDSSLSDLVTGGWYRRKKSSAVRFHGYSLYKSIHFRKMLCFSAHMSSRVRILPSFYLKNAIFCYISSKNRTLVAICAEIRTLFKKSHYFVRNFPGFFKKPCLQALTKLIYLISIVRGLSIRYLLMAAVPLRGI